MVRLGGDINGIEVDIGDTITVNGHTWTYQSDGTLSGPAIDTEEVNNAHYTSQKGWAQALTDAVRGDAVYVDGSETVSAGAEVSDGVTVIGLGGTITLADGAGGTLLTLADNATDVSISGLILDGNKANQSSGARLINAGNSSGTHTNISIEGNTLLNGNLDGIRLVSQDGANLRDVRIHNNSISGMDSHGIVVGPSTTSGAEYERIVVADNVIDADGAGSALGISFFAKDGGFVHHAIASGNTIRGHNGGVGFESTVRYSVCANNSITAVSAPGVSISSTSPRYNVIVGNTISDAGGTVGIRVGNTTGDGKYTIIANNTIANPGTFGIATENSASENVIHGNIIRHPGNTGVDIGANSIQSIVRDNWVVGNGAMGRGIHGKSDELVISGNIVEHAEFTGIRIDGSRCSVTNNSSKNNGHDPDNTGSEFNAGITVDAIRNVVVGNVSYDDQGTATQQHGIYETTNGDFNNISANLAYDNSGVDVVTNGTNTVVDGSNVTTV